MTQIGRNQDREKYDDKDSDSVTSSRSEEDDDDEWSEPFQKPTSTSNRESGVKDTSNSVRVDFTGSLIDAARRSVTHSELEDSLSGDLLDEIEHAPMYPSYSSRFLTVRYS